MHGRGKKTMKRAKDAKRPTSYHSVKIMNLCPCFSLLIRTNCVAQSNSLRALIAATIYNVLFRNCESSNEWLIISSILFTGYRVELILFHLAWLEVKTHVY